MSLGKLPPSLTAVVELTAAEPKLELAMALTAMRLTVVVEMVVMITFLFSNMHCRALPGTPAMHTKLLGTVRNTRHGYLLEPPDGDV